MLEFILTKFYYFIWILLTPFIPLITIYRILNRKEEIHKIKEKFGLNNYKRPEGNLIWINAASLGEARSAIPLIKEILKYNVKILFTTVTITSAKHIKSILEDINNKKIIHQYSPIDHPFVLWLFYKNWKPNSVILVESEIWPNIIIKSFKNNIPIILIQGRMSQKSYKKWHILKKFSKNLFTKLSLVIAQDNQNSERYKKLGAKNVLQPINLKNKLNAPKMTSNKEIEIINSINDKLVLLFASIHEDIEDEAAILAHIKAKEIYPELITIVVPRHPNNIKNILNLSKTKNLNIVIRNSLNLPNSSTDIYIVNTIGELGSFYKISNICFIGGSLSNKGGHNLIEPALEKCAIIFGPDVSNQKSTSKILLDNKCAIQINNLDELENTIIDLISNKEKINYLANKAYEIIEEIPSPANTLMNKIKPILKI